jgi:tRNA(Ile)-lysidine synthase
MTCSDLAETAFRAFDHLAGDEPALGVAVSGGSDSTALLLLAHDRAKANNKRLAAATLDHGLRPEAAAEAATVAALCRSLGVPHRTLTWRPTPPVSQADARDERHRQLALWCEEERIPVLALGHTLDDRIETFLMRLRAGSGWYGLAAPLPSSPSPAWPEGRGLRLIRPLSALSREALRDELRHRGQGWIDDPSNEDPKHERIRARRLAAQLPLEARARIAAILARLARLRSAAMAEARGTLSQIAFTGHEARLDPASLAALSQEGAHRLLEALILAAGGAPSLPRSDALTRLLGLALGEESAAAATLANAWFRLKAGSIVISPAPARRGGRPPAAPDWNRARSLLGDPHTDVLNI